MIFQSLTIHGFKSFADKTLIEFPAGITAIVGPNGSGKSNIMDSLRWVFGEQRATELRGSDMEDVIFAGSEKRRPAGYAEVTLTLSALPREVTEKWGTFGDISVTRKIYRIGDREYLINGRKCRLKDIRDIFFDTGLGSRSISIIEQERVTKIVNSSPDELRYFLEETAGVVRYKERRKEAETRLAQTRANLARIDDLMAVLAGDIEHIAEQVERVKQYRTLRQEKLELEKQFLCVIYSQLVKERDQLDASIEKSNIAMSNTSSKQTGHISEETAKKRQHEELRETLKKLRAEYEELHKGELEAEGRISHYQANISSAGEQKEQLAGDIERTAERADKLTERLEQLSETIQDAFDYISDFEEQAESAQTELDEHRQTLDGCKQDVKRRNDAFLETSQRLTEYSNKINIKQMELSGYRTEETRLHKEKAELVSESGTIDGRIEEQRGTLTQSENEVKTIDERLTAIKDKLDENKHQKETLQGDRAKIDVALQTTLASIELLKRDIASKLISEEGKVLVEEFGGRPYLEVAGQQTDDEMLLYLDIFVFDDSKKQALLEHIQNIDISIKFIFNLQLGEAKNTLTINKIGGRLYQQGALYHNIGSDNQANIVRRLRAELDESDTKATQLNEQITSLTEQLDALTTSMEQTHAELDSLTKQRGEFDNKRISAAEALKHLLEQKERMMRNASVIDKEIVLKASECTRAVKEAEELAERHKQATLAHAKTEREYKSADEKLSSLLGQLDELKDKHESAMRELAKYQERKQTLQSEKAKVADDRQTAQTELNSLKARLDELADVQVGDWQRQLADAKAAKDELVKRALGKSAEIKEREVELIEVDKYLEELRSGLDKLTGELHEIDKKAADYRSKRETAVNNLNEVTRQAKSVYNIDIEETYKQFAGKELTRQQVQDNINNIDRAIDELGALNMAAEEEYSVKSEQYGSQTAQKADIERAIGDLTELISDIDSSTVQIFADTYTAVRQNFLDVFTRFFGSGTADLRLTNPDDMLTTGVELVVMPPGKRVSTSKKFCLTAVYVSAKI
ncbi:chromosome partition protein Smc [Deferribacterales bacterium]|nr:chromosome partition protein Smc [Deferribacterales bacterium]